MHLSKLVLLISKCPEEYTDVKHVEMPTSGGSIGRAESCTLALIDHNRFLSGTHCLVSVYGGSYYISDVSTNGTLVNGHKIQKNQPVVLSDGDRVALGQYEIVISFEAMSKNHDIASGISPERESNDPLQGLNHFASEQDDESSALENLFKETAQDDVDNHDPISHLEVSSQNDDHLIRDDVNLDGPKPKPSFNARQVADDSFSVHSEFDLPSLIPEDWMAGRGSDEKVSEHKSIEDLPDEAVPENYQAAHNIQAKQPPLDLEVNGLQHIQPKSESEYVNGKDWEDVTQDFLPPTIQEQQIPVAESSVELVGCGTGQSKGSMQNNELSQAFYEGLGITSPDLTHDDTQLFKQMGTCLRLCMENLQKDLRDVELFKGKQDLSHSASDLTELMLTLNSQNLLAPNELVEQILSEIGEHQVAFNKAVHEVILDNLDANDPVSFSSALSRTSMFKTKSKLWEEYLAFYAKNRSELHETSLIELIKKNYNQTNRGNHA